MLTYCILPYTSYIYMMFVFGNCTIIISKYNSICDKKNNSLINRIPVYSICINYFNFSHVLPVCIFMFEKHHGL